MTSLSFPQGTIYTGSIVTHNGTTYALAKMAETGEKCLLVEGDKAQFSGTINNGLLVCPLTAANAAELRAHLQWLNPLPLGRQTSFGFGDRLGSATPGHVASLRAADTAKRIAPIFAQQSVRENKRTGRRPQGVLDDAMWGVFQEGWHEPWGADADHIKEASDLASFIDAGYTFFTIDPSDYVDNEAQTAGITSLKEKAAHMPWERLGSSYEAMKEQYCATPQVLEDLTLIFDEETFLRALVKYGLAILHTAEIAAILDQKMADQGYDLEMSVDETDTPTSVHEHYFIANELHVRGIPVVSLAPRFVGKFQKGVDYMGDIVEFEAELARHMAILHHYDSYKISIHTGSDKFSIYGIINDQAQGYVHVKTAGTSYLEALRVIAGQDPPLFRKMLDLAHENFEKDRKTYFVDCRPDRVPTSDQVEDGELPDLLEQFDARQLLHVTFGSILDAYGAELEAFISAHEALYRAGLETHFARHLRPFC
jgi:tagaturonate epimerase